MRDALIIYFEAEKNAGLFIASIGIAELAAAALLFRADLRSWRSISWRNVEARPTWPPLRGMRSVIPLHTGPVSGIAWGGLISAQLD